MDLVRGRTAHGRLKSWSEAGASDLSYFGKLKFHSPADYVN